jgi:hypothetical protein
VVRLLLERGADPTIAADGGWSPLMTASLNGRLETVRLLLDHPSVKTSINHRGRGGRTALWCACLKGRGGVVRALLESVADPTVARNDGTTPTATAKEVPQQGAGVPEHLKTSAEGRRECVAALEVRSFFPSLSTSFHTTWLSRGVLRWAVRQEAERAYQLWKARQVADQQGSGAVAVPRGQEGEEGRALVDWVVHGLKGDLFPDLVEVVGWGCGGGLCGLVVVLTLVD